MKNDMSGNIKYFVLLPIFLGLAGCGQSGKEQRQAIEDLSKQVDQMKTESYQKLAKLKEEQLSQFKTENDGLKSDVQLLKEANDQLMKQLTAAAKGPPAIEKDNSVGEIPIVERGDKIVINLAGSNGTRYLLVELSLKRANENDRGFCKAIEANSKTLKRAVVEKLSKLNVQQCNDPAIRPRLILELKQQFQKVLGEDHPIKDVILATWVMQ